MTDKTDIVERLRRKHRIAVLRGGGTISALAATHYLTDDGMRLVNPDGPEAADLIASLRAERDVLAEALEDMCGAAEYWAGCDEGCDADTAGSEIMSSGGAWPAQAYDKARQALQKGLDHD